MKSGRRKTRGHRRPSPKALKTGLDQLAQWTLPGVFVRLVVSHGMQPLNVIGRLREDPLIPNERNFTFTSLSGEVYLPLLPQFCEVVRLESIGNETVVVMEDGSDTLSVRKFDFKPQAKPAVQNIEKASQQLSTWAAANTPISMALYGPFFVFSIEGQLDGPTADRPDRFTFTAAENLVRAAVTLSSAESVTTKAIDEGVVVWVEGQAGRILFAELHSKEALARLLRSSGGRVN